MGDIEQLKKRVHPKPLNMFDAIKLVDKVGEDKAIDIMAKNLSDWIDDQIIQEYINA